MILPRVHIHRIMHGRKTRLTRPLTDHQREPYQVGRRYPIQRKANEEALCQVFVVQLTAAHLLDVDAQGAWDEGFKTVEDYLGWWTTEHGEPKPDVPVWVVRFRLVTEQPHRLLSKQQGQANPAQYVTNAMGALPDEPEAVPRMDQERFTLEAHQQGTLDASTRAHARRERWSLAERLQRLEAEQHVDHSSDLRVIKRRIEAMEDKRDGTGEAAA